MTSMPRKPVAPSGRPAASRLDLLAHAATIGVPIAWKPPSTWMISAVIARAASESRKLIVSATGAGSSTSQPQRRLALPRVGEVAEARDAARGERAERAGGHEVHAHAARAEVAREVARRWPPAPPWPRPSSRRPARRPARRSPGRRSPRPPPGTGPAAPTASAFSENARRLERGDRALRRRVEEVAAERVLGREGDRVQDAVDAPPALAQVRRDRLDVLGLVDVELEHVGRPGRAGWPSGRSSASRGRSRSARSRRRPPGPGAATSNAIDSRLMTPVIRSFLPSEHSQRDVPHSGCRVGDRVERTQRLARRRRVSSGRITSSM